MSKRKRTRAEIQSELDQHNRNVSWTCGRAGVEGNSLDPELMQSMLRKSRELEKELAEATR